MNRVHILAWVVVMLFSHTIQAGIGQTPPKAHINTIVLDTGIAITRAYTYGAGIMIDAQNKVYIDSAVTMTASRASDSLSALNGRKLSTTTAAATYQPILPAATSTTNGILQSADWVVFNGKQPALGYTPVTNGRTLTISGTTLDLSANRTWSPSTSDIPEGSRLYYTDIRAQAAITAGSGISVSAGVITNTAQYIAPTLTAATRPINSTTWTISSTKQASATYYISISCTATISGPATGQVELQYSTNAGSTWIPCGIAKSSNTVSLAVVLNSVVVQTTPISVIGLPANALLRMVQTISGTATVSYIYGFENY